MKRRDILLLLVSSVILVISWIIFSIIHQFMSSTINSTVSQAITPIQPTFDIAVINKLKTRQPVAPVFSSPGASTSAAITPTIPPFFQQVATQSATPTPTVTFQPTPTASQGGSTR